MAEGLFFSPVPFLKNTTHLIFFICPQLADIISGYCKESCNKHGAADFISFGYKPSVGFLCHTVIVLLVLEDPLYCFPQWPGSLIVPSTVYLFFSYLYVLTDTRSLSSYDTSCSNQSQLIFHCGCDLHFSNDIMLNGLHLPFGYFVF